jgi:transcriptional regulator with XRE-family HTH domain
MASPRGKRESARALALGATVRKLRRERGYTLNELARRIPMSASNLSRVELGSQGPPADEIIESIATALDAPPDELLHAAGRTGHNESFEETVLRKIDALGRDVREIKDAVAKRKP